MILESEKVVIAIRALTAGTGKAILVEKADSVSSVHLLLTIERHAENTTSLNPEDTLPPCI